MTHIAIILAIVCGAMFMATKVIDLLFGWLNIMPKREGIQPSKSAQITERILDSLQLQEYSSCNYVSTVNTCEIEVEGVDEGLQAIADPAVEHISAIIEGLSHS